MLTPQTEPTPRRRKARRTESDAVRDFAEKRSIGAPLLVTGISQPGKHLRVMPNNAAIKLNIDPSYQRGRMDEVNKLIRVLQNGGLIPDPVRLCRRPWAEDKETLWIVDGYQRFCAFSDLHMEFNALVYESESLEAERKFFLALNRRVPVSANGIVKAWNGPASDVIVKADSDPLHPLHTRVHFGQGRGGKNRADAAILVRSLRALLTGTKFGGDIYDTLKRLDVEIPRSSHNRAMVEHFLRLVALVYIHDRPLGMPTLLLAYVAHDRWCDDVVMPRHAVIKRLQEVNWRTEVPSFAQKYADILRAKIERIWK